MKYIYLDQNKWIELLKGLNDGKESYIELYRMMQRKVQECEWAFPISLIHITEAMKRKDEQSRKLLLDLMYVISCGYSISDYSTANILEFNMWVQEQKIDIEDTENLETEVKADEEKIATENAKAEQNTENNKATEEDVNPLQEKYDNLNNQYIRLAADFDNYRKRHEQEKEALLKYGAEKTLQKMIEVLDNFERGLKAIETVDDCEKVKECYNLAYKNFTDVLTKAGLETIKAEGEEFDPNFHEAVMQTPTSDKPEHTIVAELQKGYKLGDKVLRPTLVNVAVAE